MSDSMFGRPSQHLLPVDADPAQPLTFKDFRFNSIGKQPKLLGRISSPRPDHTDYHSPTPSPTSTPPPIFANDGASQSISSSRPTPFQQLAGHDFSSMDGGRRWRAPTGQSNGSLASRIQMTDDDIAHTAHGTADVFPSPPLRVGSASRATENASLIPPVEVLSQAPSPSPSAPASFVAAQELVDTHSPPSSTPLLNMTTTRISRIPTPATVTTNTTSREPTQPLPTLAAVDAMIRDIQPSPSAATAIDSLAARQKRLQAISANLANLASPLYPPSSHSSSPDPSSATRANDNVMPDQPSQSQHSSTPIILRHPYSTNQSSGQMGLGINDIPMGTSDPSLALVRSPTSLTQEYQTQHKVIIEAVQSLNSALSAVHRAQIDSENALALQIRTFEEQRAAFEQMKRAEEARLQQEFQELQQKREQLNAKEASLASLEKESKAREVTRKAVLAQRQAQEEERRASEAKRTQDVQEQIANAVKELMEVEALRANGQLGQLAGPVPDNLPTEPREGMDEEEITVIKSRNDLLCAVKHLRRMHTDKVEKLEESNRTLRGLEEERKKRETIEAERRRMAEEERLRGQAEVERARQFLEEKRRQTEAERKRQEAENAHEQARPSVEQQTHVETETHGSRRTGTTNAETLEHRSRPEEASASQQQATADMTRIRADREANSLSKATTGMSEAEDGKAFAPPRTVPSSDNHTSPGGSQSTTPQLKQKKDVPVSGGVMLATSNPKGSGGHLPPKLLAKSSALFSDHVAENVVNPARTTPGRHRSSFPAQLASEFNRVSSADIRPTPDPKPAFPRTPKSQTILDPTNRRSLEFDIEPAPGVSPTQQNVNLRHLKRSRGRVEENDSGDRSVRNNVKIEENSYLSLMKEGHDDQSHALAQASLPTNPSVSLPPRPAIIPPPRPRISRKRHAAPASQTELSSSYPPESNESSSTKREAEVTTDVQPQETSQGSPSFQGMNTPVQLPAPAEVTNSLLLGPVYQEPQSMESRVSAGERPNQDRAEDYKSASSQSASTTLSRELDTEDPSRNNRFTDEYRRSRNRKISRRPSDHYSPPLVTSRSTVASPTQPHRLSDSWRPPNPSSGPRAEPMRVTSPTTGRKRPLESNDNEHGHRVRRQRDDAWIAQDRERDRADSYWDRRLDSELDERRAAYHASVSPPDRILSYPPDMPRATYENRAYVPPSTEEPAGLPARWEQSYRRSENDNAHQRYQPFIPSYNANANYDHTGDVRVGQTYEPMTEERMDTQPDPSLLARMSATQRFQPSTNSRGRARGEPGRGRGDSGRGRGRGVARGGPALLERLTSGPSSLGDRLT